MYESSWPAVVADQTPWDVVVLGAGPAGAIASRQLARQGRRVLLIEKAHLPRAKVCGGCLGGGALDVLETVGLGDLPTQCGGVTLHRMHLASGGRTADIAITRRIAISRETFDDALVRECVRSGVTLCDQTSGALEPVTVSQLRTVTLRRDGNATKVSARAVLVATGLAASPSHCTTQTWQGSRIGLGAVLSDPEIGPQSAVLHMAFSVRGYVGIAPVEGRRLELAAAVDPQALAAAPSVTALVASIVNESGLPPLPGLEQAAWRGTPLLTRQTRPLAAHRCLLIGDAAGYVEPFTGEGMGWAMQSALLASSLLPARLETWDETVNQKWHQLYTDTLIRRHRRCGSLVRLLGNQAFRKLAIWSLGVAPVLARPIVRQFDRR